MTPAGARLSDLWRAPFHDFPVRDEILHQHLALDSTSNVLEIGPGSGFTAFRLARRVRSLTLADVSPEAVAALAADLEGVPNVRCVTADVTVDDFRGRVGGGFDAAFGLDVFEYVTDPAACLQNLADALRPDGELLLTYPNVPPPVGDGVTYFEHAADLERLLEKAGFRRWETGIATLRPWPARVYRALHERPLGLYRRLRARERIGRPQTYEATWAFRHGRRLLRYKLPVHLAWLGLDVIMRLGGPFFAYTLASGRILGHQLVVRAWR
jgi:SAM-dependent methyltransferase